MDLHFFPLDSQKCGLTIESYGYSTDDIIYNWAGDEPITLDPFKLPQFTRENSSVTQDIIKLSTGNYSRLYAHFLFSRSLGFYLIQIYLPSQLIVIISWVSFWLSRDATPARVSLGVTTVLTMTTLMTTTNAAMPKVSYIKSLDIYLITCFLMVFASLLEYAAVGYLNKRLRMRKETKLQQKQITGGNFTLTMQPQQRPLQYGAIDARSDAVPFTGLTSPSGPPKPPIYATKAASAGRKMSVLKRRQPIGALYQETSAHNPHALVPMTTPIMNNNEETLPPCTCGPNFDTRTSVSQQKAIVLTAPKSRRNRSWKLNPSNIDKYSRIIFPLFFAIFNAMYWSIYKYLARKENIAWSTGAE